MELSIRQVDIVICNLRRRRKKAWDEHVYITIINTEMETEALEILKTKVGYQMVTSFTKKKADFQTHKQF